MSTTLHVKYWAEPVLGGKFVGRAVLTWKTETTEDPRLFHFERPFDTPEEAAQDAKQLLVEAFGGGEYRGN